MKKTITLQLLFCALAALPASAQSKGGEITQEMLATMQKAYEAAPANKAVFNAIASNRIDDLAKNFANKGDIDKHFSIETPTQSIHNQLSSGRCWMFSGLNVLRANFALQHKDTLAVEFSQDYLFFYDQLEKANLMLQGVIDHASEPIDSERVRFFFKHPLNDGGTFCGVSDLAEKYGLVPMSAQPETYSAENTSKMSALVSSKLREYGLELRRLAAGGKKQKALMERKTEMLSTIYNMLCLTLGEPVKTFTYAFRDKDGKQKGEPQTYTPLSFYEATVGKKLNGSFIMVMNDPRHEYHKTYEVEYDRHTYDGHNWRYLNLPMEEIAQLAIKSLKNGHKMYSSYDVGKQFDRSRGYLDTRNYDYGSLFSTTFPMDKAQRIATFDSGSTHAMTLTAVDTDSEGNPVKWKVENSWGPSSGQAGCLIMTNEWFNEYMFRLVVDKQYATAEQLSQYGQKPTTLMPEDPLFAADE